MERHRRVVVWPAALLLAVPVVLLRFPCVAQPPSEDPRPMPRAADTPASPPLYGAGRVDPDTAVGLTILDALRLAQLANLDIGQARQVVLQAYAQRERARVQWLPSANIGSTFVNHNGRIQQANGNILNVN